MGHQLAELERLLAESQRLTVGSTLDGKMTSASLMFELQPIAGSSLSNDVAAFGAKPSMFAAMPRDPKAILSIRGNHPISEFRQANLTEFLAASLPDVLSRLQGSKLSDAEKTAGEAFAKHLNKLLGEGVKSGIVDGFVEVTPEGDGHHTSVTGLKVPEGTELVELVKLLAATNPKHKLEANVAKFGSVDIHKLTVHLGPKLKSELGAFFSDSHVVYLGAAGTSFWSAAGPSAEAKLKAAIETIEAAEPAVPSPVVIDLHARLLPWLQLNDKVEAAFVEGKKPATGSLTRTLYDLRKVALTAFAGNDDLVTLKVSRTESGLEGTTTFAQGALRLLGKKIAEFSETFSTE